MTLPTKEERIRRKKVMQDAGISVPNTDSSWGPWWEEQWKKAITHTKTNDYYGVPSVWNLARRTFDNITGNTTYEAEPQPIGGTIQATDESTGAQIKRTLNNWQHYGDPVRDVTMLLMPDPSKPIKASKAAVKAVPQLVKSVPKLFTKEGAKKVGAKTAETVIREVPRATAGYYSGKGVDKASKAITGKSWAENASDKMSSMMGFHIEPIFGDITNPGYIGGYKWVDRGIKRASFNHITPISYDDKMTKLPLTKLQEGVRIIGNTPKQLISFRKIETPAWRTRLENMPGYNPEGHDFVRDLSNKQFIDNREDALRLVFGQPTKTPLYTKNSNGTYGYDLDFVHNQQGLTTPLVKDGFIGSPDGTVRRRYLYIPKKFSGKINGSTYQGYGDNLGFNGGSIGYTEKDGISYISDVFDVQPFHDSWRMPDLKGAEKIIHKYTPDLEVFRALGGKPFKLEMQIPTYVDPYPSF